MSGVNFAMIPEITGCDVSKISAQIFLDDVLSHVPARHDGGFSQRKVLRAPDSFMPWLFELFFDAPHQFVELLWVKP